MIRECRMQDLAQMVDIINESAVAYKGHIPDDCYHEPYMPLEELRSEIDDGVEFFGFEGEQGLVAVMGIQDRGPVTLIRHAYTAAGMRGKGIGSVLIVHLMAVTTKPLLVGTWRDAAWAIRFYEKFGFRLVSDEAKDRLLGLYWSISSRQAEMSVVLGDEGHRQSLQ